MRVVIAEDSVLLRAGLERLLADEGIDVAAVVSDAPGLLAATKALRPDVAIVDVRLPPSYTDEGLRAALEIRQTTPATAILILSQYVEERYASRAAAPPSTPRSSPSSWAGGAGPAPWTPCPPGRGKSSP